MRVSKCESVHETQTICVQIDTILRAHTNNERAKNDPRSNFNLFFNQKRFSHAHWRGREWEKRPKKGGRRGCGWWESRSIADVTDKRLAHHEENPFKKSPLAGGTLVPLRGESQLMRGLARSWVQFEVDKKGVTDGRMDWQTDCLKGRLTSEL